MRNAYLQMCDYGSRFRILKGGKISLVVSAFIASTTLLQASPTGGVVTSGSASIAQSGAITTIIQTTNKAAINWNNFSIAKNEIVNFNQPNVNAVTLNRVVGNEKSIIDGAMNANGQVFILNSNGVLFSKNASINTAGLVATTMNLSDTDFMNGNYNFKGDSSASVINQGTINISDKGYAALFGKEVINEGIIKATLGKAELVGAKEVTLNLNGNSLVSLHVNKGVLDALVENKGAIYADGGEVYLTTNAINELLKGVVNNTGIVEANSIDDITGKIELFAHGGEAQVGGTIKAEGGFVETSGKEFTIKEGAIIKAKEWLIDPVNITIDSTLAGTISTALGSGDVTITTDGSNTPDTSGGESGSDGDIFVNSAITWASDNDLTLNAYRDIAINKNITATGTGGKLSLLYGQGSANGGANDDYTLASGVKIGLKDGQNFSTRKGTTVGNLKNYTVISTLGTATGLNNDVGLQGMQKANSTVLYAVGADIDASSTSTWNSGAGFTPIGLYTSSQEFTGSFDGLGHTIDSLYINNTTAFGVGLFGSIDKSTGTIRNINLTNVDITGTAGAVGALAGAIKNLGTIQNVSSSTKAGKYVSGGGYVGGLIGYMPATGAVIKNVSSSANVSVDNTGASGGLIGLFQNGSLSNAYATGSVTGTGDNVGGLIGYASYTTFGAIDNVYATGNVSAAGKNNVGGLVGTSFAMPLSNSYATGTVTGGGYVGGLVGKSTGVISSSYATGDVTGSSNYVGGFIGSAGNNVWLSYSLGNVNQTNGAAMDSTGGFIGAVDTAGDSAAITILKSYSSGTVTNGFGFIGKEVGDNYGNVHLDRNYWSSDVTDAYSIGMTFGYTPSAPEDAIDISGQNLYSQGTYTNFDFGNEWYIIEGKMKPILRSEYSTTIGSTHQLQLIGMNSTTLGATYTQSRNLDFVSTTEMAKTWNPDNYFVSIGDNSNRFKGNYDGNGKTISNINIINNSGDTGLFGSVGQGVGDTINITNVGLLGGTITHNGGSGNNEAVGALVGYMRGDSISNSYSTATVISDGKYNGGLVGILYNGILSYSYSAGAVQVSGGGFATGGLVGFVNASASANNNYSTSSVTTTGGSYAGGFAGFTSGNIYNSYSAGAVSGSGTLGGFIGSGSTPSGNNFWDTEASGQTNSGGEEAGSITGKTTAQMKTSSTFSGAGWDTSTIWGRKDTLNNGYMVLKGMYVNDPNIAFSTPITITLNGDLTKTYGDANPTINYTSSDGSVTLGWGSAMTQYANAGTYIFSSTSNIFTPTYGSGTADDWVITWNYGSYGITVNPYTLALSGFTADNKVYNANTTASVTGTLGAALNGDTVNLTGTFADKNVGTGKTVTAGVSNSNYTIAATTTTADITAKVLSAITGITASTKTYDGLTSSIIDFASAGFTGIESGDTLSISAATGTYDTKNVGTGKTVTISGITLSGADAGNYSTVGLTPTTTADITAKAVTLSAPDVTREYNGNAIYTASASDLSTLSALLGVTGDTISAITLAFDNKNVGTDTKTLTPSAAIISDGNSGNNYAITYSANTTSTISPKALSLSGAVANNKVYDGSANAIMSSYGSLIGMVGSEVVTIDISSATSAFADKNVGTDKTVTILGVTLGGADAGNYTAGSSLTTTADITAKAITISGLASANKIYDGTTTAVVNGTATLQATEVAGSGNSSDGKAYTGDTVNLAGIATGTFNDKDVADATTVTFNGLSLTGADAGNYTLTPHATEAHTITAKAITISGLASANKTYDGTTTAVVNGTATLQATEVAGSGNSSDGKAYIGDTVNLAGTATGTFNDKDVADATTVTFNGLSLTGADAGNYTLTPHGTEAHTIVAKALSLNGAVADNKVYDGLTTAAISSYGTLVGMIGSEVVTIDTSSATSAFSDKNVGTGKTVTISGITLGGADAANYAAGSSITATANITAKALTAITGITASNKTYDGTTTATLDTTGVGFSGKIGGDTLSIATSNATFDTKNVGTGKTVTISGIALGGADAGNYSIVGLTSSATADIMRLASVTWIGGTTGDWSNPVNWAGGAIPDFSNVANVIIPAGKTVLFDAGLGSSVHVDNIASLGGLNVVTGTLNVTNLLSTANYNQTGGTVVGHDMTVTTSYTQPAGVITMSGDLTINQAVGNVAVGEILSNNLNVSTTNGTITQVGSSTITSTTSSTFIAGGDNDITLANDDNEFGVLTMSGNDVSAKDKDILSLGNIIATGTVGITTTNGDISQSSGSTIEAGGGTTIIAGGDKDIMLNNDNNDFNYISVTGNDIIIKDKDDIELGDISAIGTAQIETTLGNITQSSDSTVSVTGSTTLIAGGGSTVELKNLTNTFGEPINITASAATIGSKSTPAFGTLIGLSSPTVLIPSQTNGNTIQQVVDSIIQSVVRPPVSGNINPSLTSSIGTPAPLFASTDTTTGGFNQGVALSFVSQPTEGEANQRITLNELRTLQQPSNEDKQSGSTPILGDVRIALAQNSLIGLVNGGVRLPEGVDQEFYVVEDRRALRR